MWCHDVRFQEMLEWVYTDLIKVGHVFTYKTTAEYTKRESKISQHFELLEQIFKSIPDNVAVNWPLDKISIYDIADQADVFLNSWSSVGKEMALLGIPVVEYSKKLLLYPMEINYYGLTLDGYFDAIDKALFDGWSLDRARLAFRWFIVEFFYSVISIADSYPSGIDSSPSNFKKFKNRLINYIHPLSLEGDDCDNRKSSLLEAKKVTALIEAGFRSPLDLFSLKLNEVTYEEESKFLNAELLRIANALYPNLSKRKNSQLYRHMTQKN